MSSFGVIELESKREIKLMSLDQWLVNAGLLVGYPTDKLNARTIEGIATKERETRPAAVHVIRPTEIPFHVDPEVLARRASDDPGKPMRLPRVACVGRFESWRPQRHEYEIFSGLTFLWFQESYALPIDPPVLEQIRAIDWDSLATELDP